MKQNQNYYSQKPLLLKIIQNPFLQTPDGHDGQSFQWHSGGKTLFLLTYKIQTFFLFGL